MALLDGDVMPAQFQPDRIARSCVQQLLKKVTVRPNQEFTEEYPARMPAKVVVRLQDGTAVQIEVQDFPGMPYDPFTWEDSVEKFDRLVAGRADEAVCRQIKDAVRSLDTIPVADLMEPLRRVKAPSRH